MEEETRERFKQKLSQYDYIRFVTCDLHGQSKCKIVPARVAAEYIDNGVEAINSKYCCHYIWGFPNFFSNRQMELICLICQIFPLALTYERKYKCDWWTVSPHLST